MRIVAFVLSRYDRNSLVALCSLFVLYLGVFIQWNHLIDWTLGMDWLLGGIWAFMTLTLAWDVVPRRDLRLAGVAFVGGLVIEWWGTTTNLWHYYTAERPPIWILPAWPVAALAIDRIARVLGEGTPKVRWDYAWWLLPLFVAWMIDFSWTTGRIPSTRAVVLLMIGVLVTARDRRADTLVFVAGSVLGIFLEYWGTSRRCWTYYSREVPPPIATVAHGFASVAFSRGVTFLTTRSWAARTSSPPAPLPAK
jgi:hypothetical protein